MAFAGPWHDGITDTYLPRGQVAEPATPPPSTVGSTQPWSVLPHPYDDDAGLATSWAQMRAKWGYVERSSVEYQVAEVGIYDQGTPSQMAFTANARRFASDPPPEDSFAAFNWSLQGGREWICLLDQYDTSKLSPTSIESLMANPDARVEQPLGAIGVQWEDDILRVEDLQYAFVRVDSGTGTPPKSTFGWVLAGQVRPTGISSDPFFGGAPDTTLAAPPTHGFFSNIYLDQADPTKSKPHVFNVGGQLDDINGVATRWAMVQEASTPPLYQSVTFDWKAWGQHLREWLETNADQSDWTAHRDMPSFGLYWYTSDVLDDARPSTPRPADPVLPVPTSSPDYPVSDLTSALLARSIFGYRISFQATVRSSRYRFIYDGDPPIAPPMRLRLRDDDLGLDTHTPRLNVATDSPQQPSSAQRTRSPRIRTGGNSYS
jgi:hypothetical protein